MILLVNGEPLGRERVNNVKKYVPINACTKKFRKAKDIYNPCWLHLSGVADGVIVVSMVRHQAISRDVEVEGFWVKVSY